ncbi:MAG: hypothetical protein WAN60_14395 [Candidatus Sulfotelmatobacter sp.]
MNFPTRIVLLLAITACFYLSALAQEAPPAPTPNPPAQSAPPPDASPPDTPPPQPSHADQGQDDKEKTNRSAPQQQPGASNPGTASKPSGQAGEKQNTDRSTAPANHGVRPGQQQPKRILGIMPNFRAVSAGAIPPPPTAKESFVIASRNSFDYSSFVFVGVTSALAEWTVAHPQLGQGLPGYGRYYWRGFLDKTDGNYLVIFALPTVFHQDERYYAMGRGSIWKRGLYAGSRVIITPDYHGHNSFNISELLGRGMAQGVSVLYYPSGSRTVGALATKFAYAIGRDALTNTFREFWPDIATHVLHRQP